MNAVPVSRCAFLKASKLLAAGIMFSPALIGRAQAASVKPKCSSLLPNDPRYANGRISAD